MVTGECCIATAEHATPREATIFFARLHCAAASREAIYFSPLSDDAFGTYFSMIRGLIIVAGIRRSSFRADGQALYRSDGFHRPQAHSPAPIAKYQYQPQECFF